MAGLIADVIIAAVSQALASSRDAAHGVSRTVNTMLFTNQGQGLLHGPYHPGYDKAP